ncbi:MAG: uncharacterized protein QOH90_187 [Actinomycetota bacterium]|jgi:ketosteroid isomerase-like protein|nr:uncharacterized protein [Actinomycetota bacterium]
MAEHPNVERVRSGYNSFTSGDLEGVMNFFHKDIVFHVPGNNPVAGDYKGQDEVMGFFGRLMQETGGSFKLEVHDILANDDHGVGLVRQSGERNGKSLSMNVMQVFHIDADGKATEFWGFPEDGAAVDAFWA